MHPGGFEPPTARFVAEYSIQLSYGCKMAVRRGFEPRMQLLTAYSLSRGAPSASRPPHHTPLSSASKNSLKALRRCVAHILLSGLYKSNNFSRPFIVCTLRAQLGVKNDKKPVFSTVKTLTDGQTNLKDVHMEIAIKRRQSRKEGKTKGEERKSREGCVSPEGETRELSNWTAGIFQPGYAGRSLHGERILLSER